MSDIAFTVDHIIPVALGGKSSGDNLAQACRRCNQLKAANILTPLLAALLITCKKMQSQKEFELRGLHNLNWAMIVLISTLASMV